MSGSGEGPAGIDQGEAPWRRGPLATLAVLAVSFALVATTLVGLAPREPPSPSPSPTTTPPPQPLEPGTGYRFWLTGPDGALAGAWAFQVKGPLHVVTTLPADRSSGVPPSTGLGRDLTQDGVIG